MDLKKIVQSKSRLLNATLQAHAVVLEYRFTKVENICRAQLILRCKRVGEYQNNQAEHSTIFEFIETYFSMVAPPYTLPMKYYNLANSVSFSRLKPRDK
jgi:hypothetical protein